MIFAFCQKKVEIKPQDEKPSRMEYDVAKFLKGKLPEKRTTLLGHKVDYFIGKRPSSFYDNLRGFMMSWSVTCDAICRMPSQSPIVEIYKTENPLVSTLYFEILISFALPEIDFDSCLAIFSFSVKSYRCTDGIEMGTEQQQEE